MFRPRPTHMPVGQQMGRPAHDPVVTANLSQSVKVASDVAAVTEVASGYNSELTDRLEAIQQRLDDADIP